VDPGGRRFVLFERTLFGFNFESPWRGMESSGVPERIEGAGEAPPDAIFGDFRIELNEDVNCF